MASGLENMANTDKRSFLSAQTQGPSFQPLLQTVTDARDYLHMEMVRWHTLKVKEGIWQGFE